MKGFRDAALNINNPDPEENEEKDYYYSSKKKNGSFYDRYSQPGYKNDWAGFSDYERTEEGDMEINLVIKEKDIGPTADYESGKYDWEKTEKIAQKIALEKFETLWGINCFEKYKLSSSETSYESSGLISVTLKFKLKQQNEKNPNPTR